ncbi:MAG: sugar-transfer associated ATP-grasp domain-containing protein [Gammaproteobacteria bacterium]|jgi:hypothetical protein|nr:sugar-transfer associated ATP-grasp domain-containing protein [Gammaproteobacteria bacterium]
MHSSEGDDRFGKDPRWVRPDPQGFWRWWLAGAGEEGRALRRWLVWVWWTKPRSFRSRVGIVVDSLLSPVFIVRDAWLQVRQCGEKVTRLHGISPIRQFLEAVGLRFGSGLPPIAYYKYQLFAPERRADAHAYLVDTARLQQVLMQRLPWTSDKAILSSKRAFEDWCVAHGLSTVRSLLEIDGDVVVRRADTPLPAADLFVKPTNWRQGKGAEKLVHETVEGESVWVTRKGERIPADALEGYLKARSREIERPLLVQRCLVNHPLIHALGNGSLCTFRVTTVRDYPAPAELLSSILRIGLGNALADNFDLGGIATMVDPRTGRCGKAIAKRGDYPVDHLAVNPDTGVPIEGVELPYWRETIELAIRAHSQLEYATPAVGWDVAVLEDGPVLVEGNSLPCHNIVQMPEPMALGNTNFGRYLARALRRAFGSA